MLSTLFDGHFDRYFAASGSGAPLWMFVHVPKTAGSSMEAEMTAIHKPSANIEIDYTETTKTYKVLFDEAVGRFIEKHNQTPYAFATGHVQARHTELISKSVADVRVFSMLRNPVARIISDYRYQRSTMNLGRDAFIEKTPDFATYIARPFVHNKTAIALVPRPIVDAGDGPAAVDYVMQNYAFIGLQEMYPLCLRALTTLMGQPRSAEAKVRVNPASADNQVALTPDEEKELRRLNAMDVALFQAFTQKWKPIRDSLREYLAARAKKAA